MLDYKIEKITDKWLSSEKRKGEILSIEEKYDGIKLTIFRNDIDYDSCNPDKNWIVSYKNNVIYPFEHLDSTFNIMEYSIGISQFHLVWNHIYNVHKRCELFPKNTEIFCEFIMKKPTITRKYVLYHDIIFLGARVISNYNIVNNILTLNGYEITNNRILNFISSTFCIRSPKFIGLVGDKTFNELTDLLNMPSELYGKMEGIVLNNSLNEKRKLVQTDQYDKLVRLRIKQQYKMDDELKEKEYWKIIYKCSDYIIDELYNDDHLLIENLKRIAEYIRITQFIINHDKKNSLQIKDDLYLTTKINVIKKLKGNNNALFIGKFRIFTKGHYKVILDSLSKYDKVIIGFVGTTDRIKKLQYDQLKNQFANKLEMIEIETGDIIKAINKCERKGFNINSVCCGEDRKDSYSKQLEDNPSIKLAIFDRNDMISTTKLLEFVITNNVEEFYNQICPIFNDYLVSIIFKSYKEKLNNGEIT